jgi:pectate lyase
VDVRPPRSSILCGVALGAVSTGGCGGDLHPIRISDAASPTDMSSAVDVPLPGICPNALVGFATMSDLGGEPDGSTDAAPTLLGDAGVTPSSGPVYLVDASATGAFVQFSAYANAKMPGPLTIVVRGMIAIPPPSDGGSADVEKIRVSSNKTVFGADGASGFTGGGLAMTNVSNVTIRNLIISMPAAGASSNNVDAIHIEGSHQIWIDHCDLSSDGIATGNAFDGLVDISDASDFVTVSWTHYHQHDATGLIGRSDSAAAAAQDAGKNHVTYDHDWFDTVGSGPRVRFGIVHVLNTYFFQVSNFGVASTDGANVLVERSAFKYVTPAGQTDPNYGPITTILDSPATAGSATSLNNAMDATDGANVIPTVTAPPAIPYPYTADSEESVPALVSGCAGPGKITPPPTS